MLAISSIMVFLAVLVALFWFRPASAPSNLPPFFVNLNGKYGFTLPDDWNVSVNQYNGLNTLFGPGASDAVGLGGVEIFPNQKSIDAFLGGTSASYSDKTNVTVDGISGVKVRYRGSAAQNGESVVLLKDGTIYNIYIGSIQNGDLQNFSQIVSSFKFLP
ncbi:MAG: hypothetical protein KGJ13_02905 [Patescibacteria group bacterium]|nr:hypothetical protein [Patescibacteria group bacterium]